MKERPILFRPELVLEILADRKTVTRRPIKFPRRDTPSPRWFVPKFRGLLNAREILAACPYGAPGDRLWVREAWGLHDTEPKDGPERAHVFYRSTDGERHDLRFQLWRPSIFMPRWASRLTLEVVAVRVERLHEITEEQARAEGLPSLLDFRFKWNELYFGSNADWGLNPWLWVVEFKRVLAAEQAA